MIAVVCPQPPVLVPEVAGRAAADLDDLRLACDTALAETLSAAPARVIVVGAGQPGSWDASAGGTLARYGVDVRAGGAGSELPLSLTLGAWLLDRAGWTGNRCYTTRPEEPAPGDLILLMADGAAKRTEQAPGHLDARAVDFDRRIAEALRAGSGPRLASLEEELAAELWCGGATVLRWLGEQTGRSPVDARLLYDAAPYGVGYWVAIWSWE